MSTISRFVRDMGLVEGERVWVHFGDYFDITRAPALKTDDQGIAALVNAFGLDDDVDLESASFDDAEKEKTVLEAINRSLGLDADAPRRKTVQRLRHRRDDDLAEAIRNL